MNTSFIVKVKTIMQVDQNTKKKVAKPLVNFMIPEFPYAVLDTWNQNKKNDDGSYTIVTKFLIGDQETGFMHWVDAHGVLFIGVVGSKV